MSGTSTTATPFVNCHKRWGWAEIHWSDDQKNNWKLDQYTCPILSRYNIENPLPDVAGVPEEYRKKDLKSIYDEFSSKAGADVSVDLHAKLVEKAKTFEKNNGFICSAVTQWVIVEIQPITGIEWASIDALPSFDIWAFLQPRGIGVRSKMKEEYGYVSDDKPRAGWFSTEIRWFREKDPKSLSGTDIFVPRMSIKSVSKNDSQHDNARIIRWQDIDVTLTDQDSKALRFHPKRPSYGKGLRFLFKIPVTVKNIQSAQDRRNRVEAYNIQKKGGKLTEEQQRQLLRFEIGSYLKVWVRNAAFPWDSKCPPRDDLTSDCMDTMQRLDCAKLHPNERFNKPVAYDIQVSSFDKYDYRAYIRAYYTTGQGMVQELLKRAAQTAPADRVGEMARQAFDKPLIPLGLSDTTYKPAPEEDNETLLKPTDVVCPDVFQEVESDTDKKKARYQCGNEFFRPYSFRNHAWKRNRFSTSGNYEENKWHYVALWPDELIESVENLTAYFFKEPSKGNWYHVLICSVLYVLIYKGMLDIAETALLAAESTIDPGKKNKQQNIYRVIRALMDCDDLATLAAAFSRHGWPDFNEGRWLDEDEPKSIGSILEKYNANLAQESPDPAAFYAQIFQVIKSYFCSVADVLEAEKKLRSTDGKVKGAMDVLTSWCELGKFADPEKAPKKPAPSKDEPKPFMKGPVFKSMSFLEGELEIEMKEGKPRNKKLKAWPLPPPYLSWLAFVISMKSKGSLGCKIKSEKIDIEKLAGGKMQPSDPDNKKPDKTAKLSLDLTAKGEEGIFFDLAAFWTLLTQMDSTFKNTNPKTPGGFNAADYDFLDTLKKLLEFADVQLGFAVKITLNSKLPLSFDFNQLLNRQNFFSQLTGKPFSMLMDLELPLSMKLSCISKNIGTLKLPLVAASPSAIVVCPNGIELEGSGVFAGKKEKVSSGKEWLRIKIGRGEITKGSHKVTGQNVISVGQPINTEAHSLKIIPVDLMQKEGTDVPFFQTSLVPSTNDAGIELTSKGLYKKSMLYENVADSRIVFTSTFDLSQKQLKTDAAYAGFVKKLLVVDQTCSLKVAWAGYVTEMQLADKQITLLSPYIDRLIMPKEVQAPGAIVKIDFHVAHFEHTDIPLYCKLYEYNKAGMFGKHDVANREIKRKDSSQGYFRCDLNEDSSTHKKIPGSYHLNIPLQELGDFPLQGEDNDNCWEVALKITVDFEGGYPLRFSSTLGLGGLVTFSNTEYQIKILKNPVPKF